MSNWDRAPLHLRRINAALNMRRFYTLSIEPAPFGGASVVRHLGRIGASGQSIIDTSDAPEEADGALSRLERRKRSRGNADR